TPSKTILFLSPKPSQKGGSRLTRPYARNKLSYFFLLVGVSLLALSWAVVVEQSLPLHLAIILVIGSMGGFTAFVVFSARLRPSFSAVCSDCGYRNVKNAELCKRCGRQLK
ncbi:MAG: hypothetical protein ACFE7S_09445, partial [Candidatus Hodarchaeota archaeon]